MGLTVLLDVLDGAQQTTHRGRVKATNFIFKTKTIEDLAVISRGCRIRRGHRENVYPPSVGNDLL
jgi:hypothetical protein